jgi:hypothetical protein
MATEWNWASSPCEKALIRAFNWSALGMNSAHPLGMTPIWASAGDVDADSSISSLAAYR